MDTPLHDLMFFTKLLTGLVLLLNIMSLISMHLLVRWVRNPAKAVVGVPVSESAKPKFRPSARAIIFVLLFFVVAVNVLAIYGNFHLREATQSVINVLIG